MLFEYILKIGLAGKAEIAADFSQTFFAVGQKTFCFFQLAAHNVSAHPDAEFTFKVFHHIRGTAPCMSGGSFYRDRLICVVPDIGHTLIDIRGDTFRDTCFSGTLTEIQKHDILELIDVHTLECNSL